jgi:exopolysaccharide production protein ExoZ
MRFVAAAMVVIVHANKGFTLGPAGVDIFFVISGFIIAQASQGKGAGQFIRARVLRIYPLYLLCMAPWAYADVRESSTNVFEIATSLTLWPIYDGYYAPYLQVGWSLSFEMLFYVCMALTLWRSALLKPLLAAYTLALALAFATNLPLFCFIGNPIVLEFGMGLLIARARSVGPRYGALLVGLGIAGLLLSLARSGDQPLAAQIFDLSAPDRVLWWGIPAAMLVWGVLQFEPWLQGRVANKFAFLGDASYSIYLTHPLSLIVFKLLMPWPLAILCAFVWGGISHFYVEKPVATLLKRQKHQRLAPVRIT